MEMKFGYGQLIADCGEPKPIRMGQRKEQNGMKRIGV